MIYLLVPVLLLTALQFIRKGRREGALQVLKSIAAAIVAGLLAGFFIGLGARAGMAAIPVANGATPSFTPAGSLTVVVTFAGYGILLGVVYEGLFRRLLKSSGLAYGVLLMLVSWYPLAQAGAQQLTERPAFISLMAGSGLFVALMWLPYGLALETLLRRWQRRRAARGLDGEAEFTTETQRHGLEER